MDYMTSLPGVRSRADAVAGMAFFAGTGPVGKTCGDCAFRGYWRKAASGNNYCVQKCEKARKMAGRHMADVSARNSACKYFEPKDGS